MRKSPLRRAAIITAIFILAAMPGRAGQVLDFSLSNLTAGTHGPFQWKGGSAFVEVYAENGFDFGTSSATLQYSSNGKAGVYLDWEVSELVGATTDVRLSAVKIAKGFWIQLVISAGNGTERIHWSVGSTAGHC